MTHISLDRFLEEIAAAGAWPDAEAAQRDIAAFWSSLPRASRQALLQEHGIAADPDRVRILLLGDDVTLDVSGEAVPPSIRAAEAMAAVGLAPAHAAAMAEADVEELEFTDEHAPGPLDDAPLEDAGLEDPGAAALPGAAPDAAALVDPAASPPVEEHHIREVEVYPVYEPYGYVRINYDEDRHQYVYEVIEPALSEREAKILSFIENTIIDILDVGPSSLGKGEAERTIVDLTDQVIGDYSIEVDEAARARLVYYTVRDFLGFGKLDVIMRDPMIEDISCDGSDIPIFLYHRKYESVGSSVVFKTDDELNSFVIKIAQRSGRHISIANPLLDARLPDGSRLNATLAREVTSRGSTYTIRKFRPEPFTPPDLIRFGTMNAEMLAYFWMAIQHGASLIYAGGTASGKTTALNAILLFIPPQMKIVSIEDTRELNLPHPNWIPGTTRAGFGPRDDSGRQAGEIDMFDLLKAALRQRPEYIAVGEVRGQEATVLFQAMATGHAAYGTMHADSVSSVIHRLEGDPINIPRTLLEALDIVSIQMQTRIGGKRVRRTKEIVEIVGMDPNTKELLTNEVYRWDPSTDKFHSSGISYVLERIQLENNLDRADLDLELENRRTIIEWMVKKGVRNYAQVAKVVQAYYNEPEKTMAAVRAEIIVLIAKEEAEQAKREAEEAAAEAADASIEEVALEPTDEPLADAGIEEAALVDEDADGAGDEPGRSGART